MHAAWQLGKVFDDVQPDVVHAHDPMAVALAAMALQMNRLAAEAAPLVVASRRVDFHLKRHAFSKWKYRHVDVFIAASQLIAGDARRRRHSGRPHRRSCTTASTSASIDKQPRVDAHAAFWLPHGAPLVGNVAALAPHKGQKHLVAAAARVVREVPDARFLILGEGELREPLERQIKDLGLERHVFLAGFRSDALGLMKSFDLFAMSSVTEGLGSAMLEAMACRRAGRRHARRRHSRKPSSTAQTGLLVPPHDDGALADAIVRLLRDPALRQRLGDAGRARVERRVQRRSGW